MKGRYSKTTFSRTRRAGYADTAIPDQRHRPGFSVCFDRDRVFPDIQCAQIFQLFSRRLNDPQRLFGLFYCRGQWLGPGAYDPGECPDRRRRIPLWGICSLQADPDHNTSPVYFFVSSITLGTLYEGIVVLKVGANFYNYPRFFGKPYRIAGLFVARSDIIIFCISAAALLLLAYMIRKTKTGRALRSVSFDRDTASLMGINVTRTIQFAFIVSGALAGLAGVFLGINYTLYPTMGSIVVKGFIASVIGGLGSLPGAIIGAMLLGILETTLISIIGSGYAPVFTFVIMLVFLLVRPRGIAGSNIQEKA